MIRKIFIFFFVLSSFLSACNKSTSPTINPEVLVTATPPPQPETGKASITGHIQHTDGYDLTDMIIRLAVVARGAEGHGGAYILDIASSPGTVTDESGQFLIQNINPGEYVIVIGDIESTGIYEIIKESNGAAKVWNFPENQVTDVGDLAVSIILPTPIPPVTPGAYPAPTAYPSP
jgi:hypothetical protein